MKNSLSLKPWIRAGVTLWILASLSACGGKSATSVNLGGTITGLTQGSLTLSNGFSAITINANTSSFSFPAQIAVNGGYSVQVASQPVGLTCSVANNIGTASTSDITSVAVTCVPNHQVGGTIIGVNADGLQLANGSDVIIVPASNRSSFAFTNLLAKGQAYGVTVLASPAGQRCTVQNGIGVMDLQDIANVVVTCQ